VTEAVAVGGAVLAWLAMSVLTLSEARGGLALGLAGAGLGLGVTLIAPGEWSGTAAAAGGLAAGLLRVRDGTSGWGILPAGSTPRVILCAVAGAACAWIGASLLTGPMAPARTAVLAAIVLASARLLTTSRRQAALASASALALAIGVLGRLVADDSALAFAIAGAVVAVGLALVPAAEVSTHGA
jgi:hypothetical protein